MQGLQFLMEQFRLWAIGLINKFHLACGFVLISIMLHCLYGQELESSLAMKEDYIKKLESSILEQKDVNARQYSEIKLLNERLNSESRRIKSLEREDDRLRSEIAILESKVQLLNITFLLCHAFFCSYF